MIITKLMDLKLNHVYHTLTTSHSVYETQRVDMRSPSKGLVKTNLGEKVFNKHLWFTTEAEALAAQEKLRGV